METINLNLGYLPLSLTNFLTKLFASKDSIIQQIRRKTVVTTLQIRLAAQMHKYLDPGF